MPSEQLELELKLRDQASDAIDEVQRKLTGLDADADLTMDLDVGRAESAVEGLEGKVEQLAQALSALTATLDTGQADSAIEALQDRLREGMDAEVRLETSSARADIRQLGDELEREMRARVQLVTGGGIPGLTQAAPPVGVQGQTVAQATPPPIAQPTPSPIAQPTPSPIAQPTPSPIAQPTLLAQAPPAPGQPIADVGGLQPGRIPAPVVAEPFAPPAAGGGRGRLLRQAPATTGIPNPFAGLRTAQEFVFGEQPTALDAVRGERTDLTDYIGGLPSQALSSVPGVGSLLQGLTAPELRAVVEQNPLAGQGTDLLEGLSDEELDELEAYQAEITLAAAALTAVGAAVARGIARFAASRFSGGIQRAVSRAAPRGTGGLARRFGNIQQRGYNVRAKQEGSQLSEAIAPLRRESERLTKGYRDEAGRVVVMRARRTAQQAYNEIAGQRGSVASEAIAPLRRESRRLTEGYRDEAGQVVVMRARRTAQQAYNEIARQRGSVAFEGIAGLRQEAADLFKAGTLRAGQTYPNFFRRQADRFTGAIRENPFSAATAGVATVGGIGFGAAALLGGDEDQDSITAADLPTQQRAYENEIARLGIDRARADQIVDQIDNELNAGRAVAYRFATLVLRTENAELIANAPQVYQYLRARLRITGIEEGGTDAILDRLNQAINEEGGILNLSNLGIPETQIAPEAIESRALQRLGLRPGTPLPRTEEGFQAVFDEQIRRLVALSTSQRGLEDIYAAEPALREQIEASRDASRRPREALVQYLDDLLAGEQAGAFVPAGPQAPSPGLTLSSQGLRRLTQDEGAQRTVQQIRQGGQQAPAGPVAAPLTTTQVLAGRVGTPAPAVSAPRARTGPLSFLEAEDLAARISSDVAYQQAQAEQFPRFEEAFPTQEARFEEVRRQFPPTFRGLSDDQIRGLFDLLPEVRTEAYGAIEQALDDKAREAAQASRAAEAAQRQAQRAAAAAEREALRDVPFLESGVGADLFGEPAGLRAFQELGLEQQQPSGFAAALSPLPSEQFQTVLAGLGGPERTQSFQPPSFGQGLASSFYGSLGIQPGGGGLFAPFQEGGALSTVQGAAGALLGNPLAALAGERVQDLLFRIQDGLFDGGTKLLKRILTSQEEVEASAEQPLVPGISPSSEALPQEPSPVVHAPEAFVQGYAERMGIDLEALQQSTLGQATTNTQVEEPPPVVHDPEAFVQGYAERMGIDLEALQQSTLGAGKATTNIQVDITVQALDATGVEESAETVANVVVDKINAGQTNPIDGRHVK